jgi:hypothetical protein
MHLSTLPGRVGLFLALAAASCSAQADARLDELKHCLQQFDGIAWTLPYQPPLRIQGCATQGSGGAGSPGQRKLELIGELTLGHVNDGLGFDERYAALQQAMYIHFDALIMRRGYRLVGTEQGNARVEYSARTQCLMQVYSCAADDDKSAPKPPIPYVSLARYVRQAGARTITLTYKAEMKNTWSISIDGLAPAGSR